MHMESIWNDALLPAFAPLEGDQKVDVLVIGGGMAGVLCAHFLRKAGVDYALIEADRVCRGVTGRTTAKVTAQHGLVYQTLLRRFGKERARMYYDANMAAFGEYRRLSRDIPCDFEEQDAFVYTLDQPEKMQQELEALQALNIPARAADQLPLPFPTAAAVCMPHQGQFEPLKFLAGILPGLRVYERTAARAFQGRTVITDRGMIRAEKIIVATHFPILNKHGAYFLKLYQSRSYVLALQGAPEIEGMYLDEHEGGLSFRMHGDTLLLGGAGHRTGKQGGAWGELERFAAYAYPDAKITRRWATQDCMTLDGVPYVGRYGQRAEGLYVAAGFNKWGMTSAMAAAMVLRDLVLEKDSPYAPVFDPARSIWRPQLFVNGFEAVKNLLTPTAPRCPHLGCALKWNQAEHSWDCPCHGSRFDEKGHLLENPSTGDLKRK